VFQAFPYDWLIQPSTSELRKLMIGHGVAALRYSTPLEALGGAVSYHVVLTEPYGLQTLRAQARNGVRRGLECCSIERISFERLRGRLESGRIRWIVKGVWQHDPAEWQRICRAADGLQFRSMGAIVDGELNASVRSWHRRYV
jgi:hypothetical protein